MRNTSHTSILTALFALLLMGCSGDAESDAKWTTHAPREEFNLEAVKDAVGHSPDEWFAVVQEVVDDSRCYGPKDGSSCRVLVRVVDFIEGSVERPAGWEYWNMEMRMPDPWPNRRIGRQRLVLSIPAGDTDGVYGNLVFIRDPTRDDVEKLRTLIKKAV